jgi:hypothetical protein
MRQDGLNVEDNIGVRSGQWQPDARQAVAQAPGIQLKPIAEADRLPDTHQVIIRPIWASRPFRHGHDMGASPQQVDFDEMRGALAHLGLLG